MNKEFKEILERINDPNQVKNIWDTPNAILLPALVHLEKRIGKIEKLTTPEAWTREKYQDWKEGE